MIKAALFDLDGVIFDTEPQYSCFWGSQFRLYYPDRPGLENAIKGQTLTQIYDAYFTGPLESERSAVTQRLNDFELQMTFPFIAGVLDFLDDLRRSGIPSAVVTSSNLEKMARVYAQHPQFPALVDAILTSEDFARSKPDPDCYLQGAAHFGAAPAECVVFEDSINGLRSGRASGAFVVALTTTNPLSVVRPLSDLQIPDFRGLTLEQLRNTKKEAPH